MITLLFSKMLQILRSKSISWIAQYSYEFMRASKAILNKGMVKHVPANRAHISFQVSQQEPLPEIANPRPILVTEIRWFATTFVI